MKGNIACYIAFCFCHWAGAQTTGGLEQYFYVRKGSALTPVLIAHVQNEKWYGEVRYNYEEIKTFSAYAGKIFSDEQKTHSYSIIPIIGIVTGKFKGYSLGLDVTFTENNFFFCSQSQYTFSSNDHYENFMYSWSELGYEASQWIYAGLALQHLQLFQKEGEPMSYDFGAMIGFKLGKWTIPIYSFSPINNNRYFILGLNLEFGKNNNTHIR